MTQTTKNFIFIAVAIFIVLTSIVTAQLSTADQPNGKDRILRQSLVRTSKSISTKPKWGFFGTIFHLILEQVNDTKSAYNQISDLVNNQFADENAVTKAPEVNGTTETPKLTRAAFLQILDRNLKGLARLRNLEWREAKKDSRTNLQGYWNELFTSKKSRNSR